MAFMVRNVSCADASISTHHCTNRIVKTLSVFICNVQAVSMSRGYFFFIYFEMGNVNAGEIAKHFHRYLQNLSAKIHMEVI